jgi:hypothetical protein
MTNMRKLFNDILSTEGVKGILLFSFSGDLIFKEFGAFLLNLWKVCGKPIWSLKRAESTSAELRWGIWSY